MAFHKRGRMKPRRQKALSKGYVKPKEIRTVKQLKRKYNEVPLNFLFGIPDELEYQCPHLDDLIAKLEECHEALMRAKRARTTETKDGHIVKALFAIRDLETKLDVEVRTNFVNLREFAKEWKRLTIRLLNASKKPENFILKNWKK